MHTGSYILAAVLWSIGAVAAFFAAAYGLYWLAERRERYGRARRGFGVSTSDPSGVARHDRP